MHDATFIILGATGDLTRRKLLPAIYRLVRDGKLTTFRVVLAARRPMRAQEILAQARAFEPAAQPDAWERLERATSYHQLDFEGAAGYRGLHAVLGENGGQRIFYLATLPEHFVSITKHLRAEKLVRAQDKVLYEKPFGNDLPSAKRLNACIATTFSERQAYRVDHYLGKELVHNITLARFTNAVLEPLWCARHVAEVQLVMSETLGVEGRGAFYDEQGALRDVVQSHALQLLALVAMEQPKRLTGDYIRAEKARVLKATSVQAVALGQYEGYRAEVGKPGSTTETYAELQLAIRNRRWHGVPFRIKAGKSLGQAGVAIHLVFERPPCLLDECPREPNTLTISVQPKAALTLTLNSKVPSAAFSVEPVALSFEHALRYGPNTPDAYEVLLEDALEGEQALFVREDEIEESWRITDAARELATEPVSYRKGSAGPQPPMTRWLS
jgi:glucose-6-phosphate 1-dehydrogenase